MVAAVIEKDGKVLIARRERKDTLGGKWEFPGGGLEPGETPEECLKRELKEEFDIETEVGVFIRKRRFKYGAAPIELSFYKASYLCGGFKLKEHDAVKWVSPANLNRYDFIGADADMANSLKVGPSAPFRRKVRVRACA